MAESLLCFPCIGGQPQPKRRARPRLDPSMIGLPTNFRHTAHVGTGDVRTSPNKEKCPLTKLDISNREIENIITCDYFGSIINNSKGYSKELRSTPARALQRLNSIKDLWRCRSSFQSGPRRTFIISALTALMI